MSPNFECDTVVIAYHGNPPVSDVYLIYLRGKHMTKREHIIFFQKIKKDAEESRKKFGKKYDEEAIGMFSFMEKLANIKCYTIVSREYERNIFNRILEKNSRLYNKYSRILKYWRNLSRFYGATTYLYWRNRYEACEKLGINTTKWVGEENSKTTCEMICTIYLKLIETEIENTKLLPKLI